MEEALLLSLKLASLTTILLILLSLFVSYILAYFSFPAKTFLEGFLMLPIVLPPTVLGFYMIYLLSPESPVGRFFKEVLGINFLFSFEGLLLASMIYSLPFAVFPIRDAFQGVHRRHVEIAYVFGYSRLETVLRVILPESIGGLLTSASLVFAHTMGEFGVVLMVGGNIPGETQTLSIYIYDQVQALNYTQAHRASLTLLSVSLLCLSVVLLLRKRWVFR